MAEQICIILLALCGLLHTFWLWRLEKKLARLEEDEYERG